MKENSVVNDQKVFAFLSYDQRDENLVKQFLTHLAPLERHNAIEVLHKEKIQPGEPRQEMISEMLAKARLILLFVTPDFIVSASCYEQEMRQALERHNAGETCVIPILVRPIAYWTDLPLGRLQVLPENGKPITSWPRSRRDEVWVQVVEEITDRLQIFIGESLHNCQPSTHKLNTPNGLTFASIMLDKNNPYWHEIGGLTNDETGTSSHPRFANALIPDPFHRSYRQHFHAKMLPSDPDRAQALLARLTEEQRVAMEYIQALGALNEEADPSFDITLLNTTRRPIILTGLGIELVSMALVFSLPGGGPRSYTVPLDASYTIDIPNMEESLDWRKGWQRIGSSYHYIPPIQLNKVLSLRLPDPICIPPQATFRYTLLLAHSRHLANSTLLGLWVQTHEGEVRSHGLYLSFGNIMWERDAIKEIGNANSTWEEC